MLKGLDPLLGPDLLAILAAMGHGDEIVIADANFPGASVARRLVRLDGSTAKRALEAVLSVMPLDQYVERPAAVMAVVGDPQAVPETVCEFQHLINRAEGRSVEIERIERFAFYERTTRAFAVVMTGERRLYGNVILAKGVIPPQE
jgi:L-fucose mutarotase